MEPQDVWIGSDVGRDVASSSEARVVRVANDGAGVAALLADVLQIAREHPLQP